LILKKKKKSLPCQINRIIAILRIKKHEKNNNKKSFRTLATDNQQDTMLLSWIFLLPETGLEEAEMDW
jgi:hypothetical protein